MLGTRTDEFGGAAAEGIGNVFVHREFFEVHGIEEGEHVEGDVERSLGIVHEIADYDVIFAEDAIAGDEAKDFVGETGHSGEGFDFLIGESWRLQDGALNDFAAVADQRAASIGSAFYGELDTLGNGHARDLLEKRLASRGIRFGFRGGVGKSLRIAGNGGTAKLVEHIFLVGG